MTAEMHVLVLTQAPLPEHLLTTLRAVSPRVIVEHRTAETLEELGDVWQDVEVLYTTKLAPLPESAPRLRWVQGHFAGVDQFLEHPLLQRVTLTTSSGIHAPAMAEYILMMVLAFAHRLPRMIEHQQRAVWPQQRWALFVPQELRDATIGIIGYGSIGRETARLAHAFGTRVLALKRHVDHLADEGWHLPDVGDAAGEYVARYYAPAQLHAMLAECDYVVMAAPLTPETRGLLGAAEFQVMQREAVLINVARGGVIDETALIDALRHQVIGGAALDVFEQEPLPAESPLWHLPNVILSPHVSGFTPHYDERAMTLFAENLRRYVAGMPLLNVVDVQRGY
jgi:phosphoglycerate dehydrogenase-like enzyme